MMQQARVEAIRGDIVRESTDAIVNAANSALLGGGGVDGAIHRGAGPELLAACRALRATTLPNGLPVGDAVATVSGRLPAAWVVHTVGPVYSRSEDRSSLLASAYRRSLEVAAALPAATIAFPAVSAGVYDWPMTSAAQIAVRTVRETLPRLPGISLVRFVLFSDEALAAFESALSDDAPRPDALTN